MTTTTFAWVTGTCAGILIATTMGVAAQQAKTPEPTVLEIMEDTVVPESTAIFDLVDPPSSPAVWNSAREHASHLKDTGDQMLAPSRVRDNGEWLVEVRAYLDANSRIIKAAETKNFDAFLEASDALAATCLNCHAKYLGKS